MEYQFQDTNLSLIHIPIDHYSFFLQPILRLLFGEDHDEDAAKIPWTDRHKFLNISITPVECSVFCSRELADRFFRPIADLFNKCMRSKKDGTTKDDVIEINPEDFVVVRVDGGGIEAGQRVLELTSPLAMAGISIFFVTTYFSDYILVPARAHHTVTQALQQRGFVFSKSADAFVSQLSPSSPTSAHTRRPQQHHGYPGSSFEESLPRPSPTTTTTSQSAPKPPRTPPAQSVSELQTRTFARLRNNNIVPAVDRSLRLMSCAGHKDSQSDGVLEAQLRDDLMQVLLATAPGCVQDLPKSSTNKKTSPPSNSDSLAGLGVDRLNLKDDDDDETDHPPNDFSTRFLSLTLTDTEPISVLLEHRLLFLTTTTAAAAGPNSGRQGFSLGRSLLGSRGADDVLVPISLDLRDLPLEATGIVCGVAGRLAEPSGEGEASGGEGGDGEGEGGGEGGGEGVGGSPGGSGGGAGEISFLSTARAGTVIVRESELDRAVRALGLDEDLE